MPLYSPRHARPLRPAAGTTADPAPDPVTDTTPQAVSGAGGAEPALTTAQVVVADEATDVSARRASKASHLRRAAKSATANRARRARLAAGLPAERVPAGAPVRADGEVRASTTSVDEVPTGPSTLAAGATDPAGPRLRTSAGRGEAGATESTDVIHSVPATVAEDEDDDERRAPLLWLRPRVLALAAAAVVAALAVGAVSLRGDGSGGPNRAAAASPQVVTSLSANAVATSYSTYGVPTVSTGAVATSPASTLPTTSGGTVAKAGAGGTGQVAGAATNAARANPPAGGATNPAAGSTAAVAPSTAATAPKPSASATTASPTPTPSKTCLVPIPFTTLCLIP